MMGGGGGGLGGGVELNLQEQVRNLSTAISRKVVGKKA